MKDMLSKNDLKQIGDLLDVKLEEKLEAKLEEKLESKLEEKLDAKLEEKLDSKLGEVLEAVNTGFSDMQTDIEGLKKDVTGLKLEVAGIKAVMVTKDYLDQKLGTVGGKIAVLTDVLHRNGTISDEQRRAVHA